MVIQRFGIKIQAWQFAFSISIRCAMPKAMPAQGTLRYYKPQFPRAFSNRYAAGDFNDFKVKMYQPQRLLASQVKQQQAQFMEVAKNHCEQWGKMVARLECSSSPNAHMIVTSTKNRMSPKATLKPSPGPSPKSPKATLKPSPSPKSSKATMKPSRSTKSSNVTMKPSPESSKHFLARSDLWNLIIRNYLRHDST